MFSNLLLSRRNHSLTRHILSLAAIKQAFVCQIHPSVKSKSTELSAVLSRRSMLCVTSGFLLGVQAATKPSLARGTANPAFEDEVNFEPSQQARGEKIDINNAFVVREEKSFFRCDWRFLHSFECCAPLSHRIASCFSFQIIERPFQCCAG